MKIKNIKQEKGITLIALVITIIVLLILAGVAISMLSGENGILTRASEAKEKTEEAQKEEMTNLASMELDTYFITNNSKYKCAYGYVTGIEIGEKVKSLKDNLPLGYDVKTKDGANTTDDTVLTIGMQITKDEKEIARTVIFGDMNNDGIINGNDSIEIQLIIEKKKNEIEPYMIEAADVNHNGIIDDEDNTIVALCGLNKAEVKQGYYATDIKKIIIIDKEKIFNEYIENGCTEAFRKQSTYKFVRKNTISEYMLKGVVENTDSSVIIKLIPNSEILNDEDEKVDKIVEDCKIKITLEEQGKKISKEYWIDVSENN